MLRRRYLRKIAGLVWSLTTLVSSFLYTLALDRIAHATETRAETHQIALFAQSLAGRRIVIDPGHGGIDPGAISASGLEEAALNLQLSKLLGHMLRAAGAEVVYTRSDGEDLSGISEPLYRERKVNDLRARVELIRRVRPDLVVSVHCNAAVSSAWRGAQTFYGSAHKEESKVLAADVQHALRDFTATRRWANGQIGHLILEEAPSPAITVEAGFLSNPEEARLLANPDYQRRVAFAVFLGIAGWFAGMRVSDPVAQVIPSPGHSPVQPVAPQRLEVLETDGRNEA